MSTTELEMKIRELRQLQQLIEELQAGRCGPEKGPAGGGGLLHPHQHRPPLLRGIEGAFAPSWKFCKRGLTCCP